MRKSSSAREQLTAADFAFVEAILVEELASPLKSLQEDPEAFTSILDLNVVHAALVGSPDCSPVSASLYFYVYIRRVFLDAGIEPAAAADRVAGEIVDELGLSYVSLQHHQAIHIMSVMRCTPHGVGFHLQIAAGDKLLVLNGNYQGASEAASELQNTSKPGDSESTELGLLNLMTDRCVF